MELAQSIGCPWLLLLDQDTSVPEGFLERMLEYSIELQDETRVATIVPFVRSHGKLVSPRQFGGIIRNQQIPKSVTGLFKEDAYATNSGTLMRVSALREVGGYSEEFWLDLSDAYVFQTLHRNGKWMYIAGDLELPHSIEALDFNKGMSPERYRNFLAAENAYLGIYRSNFVNLFQTIWLLGRAVRQYHRYKNKEFAKITLNCFFQRLFYSRAASMKRWKETLRSRDIPAISSGQPIAYE
jgi:GT2 family glycosyltransferase